jgi:ribonuclease Z
VNRSDLVVLRTSMLVLMVAALSGLVACDAMVDRAIRSQALAPPSVDPGDGDLHVVLCGTGSPLADPERASACTAVLAGGHFLLFDVGPGAWENLQLFGLPVAEVSGVLITHFHSDHIGGLGEALTQAWIASGRATPLLVYGPPGVDDVVAGFNRAYAHDRRYRTVHHRPEYMPEAGGEGRARTFGMPAAGEHVTVLDDGGVRVKAFVVDHAPVEPAVGYRVEFAGRSVVISGDTAPTPSLVANAKGADLLVHEALGFDLMERISDVVGEAGRPRMSKLARDVLDYHTSPAQAKQMADEAGVRLLVFTHIVPPLRNAVVERMFTRGVDMHDVVVGDDGMHFVLAAGGDAIEQESLR